MEQLLGFEADEFYFKCWPELAGLTFGQVLFCFADAVPLGMRLPPLCAMPLQSVISRPSLHCAGIRRHTTSCDTGGSGGEIWLNPPLDTVLQASDDVLVLAEDDCTCVAALQCCAVLCWFVHSSYRVHCVAVVLGAPAASLPTLLMGLRSLCTVFLRGILAACAS